MEDIEWTVVNEGQLLDAMVGHKPVGVNKYFQMALICDKFADNLRKDVNPEKVWAHLETMYNLEALDENETIPFPNSEKEFALPQSEFGELLTKKEDEEKKSVTETTKVSTKEAKKEDKSPVKQPKDDTSRRDSKDSKDSNKSLSSKKDGKKETEKGVKLLGKGRNAGTPKEGKGKSDDTPKPTKRTRGSLKSNDDSGSSGKSSPITITPSTGKRRRIV